MGQLIEYRGVIPMTYLVASGVLNAEPEELVDGASWGLTILHALLEAGPALGDGALPEVHRSTNGIPINLVKILADDSSCGFVAITHRGVTTVRQDQVQVLGVLLFGRHLDRVVVLLELQMTVD